MADYMGRDIMGWAKVLSAASFFLLLMFAVAWSSASEDSEKYLDPLQFNEAVVGPGESISVNLSSSSILGQREYLALRIVEDSEPGPDLRLVLDSEDCEWNEPGILHVDRQLDSNSPKFMIVRVFTPDESGSYVLFNDAEEGDLWLVDDIRAQTMIFQDSSVWILLMVTGCCMGGPFGLVALMLAFIGWRRNRGVSIEIGPQVPIMTTSEVFEAYRESQDVREEDPVPSPFLGFVEEGATQEEGSEEGTVKWESWDEGVNE